MHLYCARDKLVNRIGNTDDTDVDGLKRIFVCITIDKNGIFLLRKDFSIQCFMPDNTLKGAIEAILTNFVFIDLNQYCFPFHNQESQIAKMDTILFSK